MVLTERSDALDLSKDKGEIDENDFLDRDDILCSLGQSVLISNYQRHYKLVDYLGQFTREKKKALIIGINNLERIFDEKYYLDLPGGILQSFGNLFGSNIKVYIYPALAKENGSKEIDTCETFKPAQHLVPLYQYLKENGKIEDLKDANIKNLHIISDNILTMIEDGEAGWEEMVPSKVANSIKKNMLFGFKGQLVRDDDD